MAPHGLILTSRRVVQVAWRANERIGIVARAHTRAAADFLRKAGANEVEIALIARGLRAR